MKKILYTQGNFTDGGDPIILNFININNIHTTEHQKTIAHAFPKQKEAMDQMFSYSKNMEPMQVGDIIWTDTAQKKKIANIILDADNIDKNRFRNALLSIKKKCEELSFLTIGMHLLEEPGDNWNALYPIIEDSMGDVQVIVYVEDIEVLSNTLWKMGTPINKHTLVATE